MKHETREVEVVKDGKGVRLRVPDVVENAKYDTGKVRMVIENVSVCGADRWRCD